MLCVYSDNKDYSDSMIHRKYLRFNSLSAAELQNESWGPGLQNMIYKYKTDCFTLSVQVLLLIDIELSYMNTNHEDFIGFAK